MAERKESGGRGRPTGMGGMQRFITFEKAEAFAVSIRGRRTTATAKRTRPVKVGRKTYHAMVEHFTKIV